MILERYAQIVVKVKGDLTKLTEIEREFLKSVGEADDNLESAIPLFLIQGAPLDDHWQLAGMKTALQVTSAINVSSTTATTRKEVANALTRAAVVARGLVDAGVQSAVSEVRVRSRRAKNTGAFRWHSILDPKVCPNCGIRSQKVYSLDLKPIGHDVPIYSTPPLHPMCRCMLLPIELSEVKKDPDGDFDDWLRALSEDEREDLLGKGRSKLYLRNKMSASSLIDQDGLFMSLEELRGQN